MDANDEDFDLADELEDRQEMSSFDQTPRMFLRKKVLDELIVETVIFSKMDIEQPCEDDKCLAEFILKDARRLFAIAYSAGIQSQVLHKAMRCFKNSRFNDTKLPITAMTKKAIKREQDHYYNRFASQMSAQEAEENKARLWTEAYNSVNHALIVSEGSVKEESQRIWNTKRITDFQGKQEPYLAAMLSDKEASHDLFGKTLPFVGETFSKSEGSNGVITRYTVLEDHMKATEKPVSLLKFSMS